MNHHYWILANGLLKCFSFRYKLGVFLFFGFFFAVCVGLFVCLVFVFGCCWLSMSLVGLGKRTAGWAPLVSCGCHGTGENKSGGRTLGSWRSQRRGKTEESHCAHPLGPCLTRARVLLGCMPEVQRVTVQRTWGAAWPPLCCISSAHWGLSEASIPVWEGKLARGPAEDQMFDAAQGPAILFLLMGELLYCRLAITACAAKEAVWVKGSRCWQKPANLSWDFYSPWTRNTTHHP